MTAAIELREGTALVRETIGTLDDAGRERLVGFVERARAFRRARDGGEVADDAALRSELDELRAHLEGEDRDGSWLLGGEAPTGGLANGAVAYIRQKRRRLRLRALCRALEAELD